MEADCSGGQSSPWAVTPRRKEWWCHGQESNMTCPNTKHSQLARYIWLQWLYWATSTNHLLTQLTEVQILVFGHYPSSCFYLKHHPVYISKHNVLETGFCLCLQVGTNSIEHFKSLWSFLTISCSITTEPQNSTKNSSGPSAASGLVLYNRGMYNAENAALLLCSADHTQNTSYAIPKHCWDVTSLHLCRSVFTKPLPRSGLYTQQSRFYLKTETESSLRNIVFWKINRTVF
jgi:hypothetical protein